MDVLISTLATFFFYFNIVREYMALFVLSKTTENKKNDETTVSSPLEKDSSPRAKDDPGVITIGDDKPDAVLPSSDFVQQQKPSKHRKKKMDPPPGFYRMRERKRQKELAKRREQDAYTSSKSRRLKPNRKRRSKATSKKPRSVEEIVNGAITGAIPEDVVVNLESPSHDTRVQKFREMFEDEATSPTVRKFLF